MQMQSICKGKMSEDKSIKFFCTKKGKIAISNPPTKLVSGENSTKLFGNVIEKKTKTHITFHTTYSGTTI